MVQLRMGRTRHRVSYPLLQPYLRRQGINLKREGHVLTPLCTLTILCSRGDLGIRYLDDDEFMNSPEQLEVRTNWCRPAADKAHTHTPILAIVPVGTRLTPGCGCLHCCGMCRQRTSLCGMVRQEACRAGSTRFVFVSYFICFSAFWLPKR